MAVETAPRIAVTVPQMIRQIKEKPRDAVQFIDTTSADLMALREVIDAELAKLGESRRPLAGGHTAATTRTRAGNGAGTQTRKRPAAAGRAVDEQLVLDAVNRGFATSTKLATELNASAETIRRRLHALAANGKIQRQGAGADSRWLPVGGP